MLLDGFLPSLLLETIGPGVNPQAPRCSQTPAPLQRAQPSTQRSPPKAMGLPALPPGYTIHPPTAANLPSLKALHRTLFPVSYSEAYFRECLPPFPETSPPIAPISVPTPSTPSSDPHTNSTTHSQSQPQPPAPPQRQQQHPQQQQQHPQEFITLICTTNTDAGQKLLGAVRARITLCPDPEHNHNDRALYIQTLGVLAPWRGLGIGGRLLDEVLRVALRGVHAHAGTGDVGQVSGRARGHGEKEGGGEGEEGALPRLAGSDAPVHPGGAVTGAEQASSHQKFDPPIAIVQAHVWEQNTEAAAWYRRRGFEARGGEVVPRYYTKLRPGGAWLMERRVGVGDLIAAGIVI